MNNKFEINNKNEDLKEINGHRFYLKGLSCANCAAKIERKINEEEGIDKAVLNFSAETLIVSSDKDLKVLEKDIRRIVDSIEEGVTVTKEKEAEKVEFFELKTQWPLLLGLLVYVIAIVSDNLMLFLLAYGLTGKDVLIRSVKNILKGDIFDENFLMSIATLGAIAIGEYSEAIGVMLFYNIGELFQDYAVRNSRASINSLMDLKLDYANVMVEDGLVKTRVEDVEIDDTILVRVGEKVPLDGKVIDGLSEVDTSSISGESLPIVKGKGDKVLSGSINLNDILVVEVKSLYENSTIARIIRLLEESTAEKAESEKFITSFARIYTPIVVALALMVSFVIPTVFSLDYSVWIYRALVFLVVSCPCALVISVPLTVFASIGKASAVGALVKGGNYIENLINIDTIVLDKTNTITKGDFEVIEVKGDIIDDLAYAEYYSNHPIAQSIVNFYNKTIDTSRISGFREIIGKGIEVRIDDRSINAGNHEYMKELGISTELVKSNKTVIYLAEENNFKGYLEIGDTLKENAVEVLDELSEKRKLIMLSGDKRNVAEEIADITGIDEVHAELLPEDKLTIVRNLVDDGSKVLFVGDGINDGPVLAESNIGIAMGLKGSDIAKDVADIILMNDDLKSIVKLFNISEFSNRIIRQNIVFALGVKILVMILAAFGIASMWLGVFADVGVSLLAILNSMRIIRMKL